MTWVEFQLGHKQFCYEEDYPMTPGYGSICQGSKKKKSFEFNLLSDRLLMVSLLFTVDKILAALN
jgi:hypothetical protein